ncbi:MAG: sulfatase-like hydrolase/transferase [Candidatus Thorarchaeota archaeon]
MKKRLILITIDCLRRDRLSLCNKEKNLTPYICKFLKNSVIFDNFISNGSTTAPAFYSMFTSNIPDIDEPYAPLPIKKKRLAQIIKENRIKTCGIHSNPHLGKFCHYDLGFDYFFDIFKVPVDYSIESLRKKIFYFLNRLMVRLGIINYKNKLETIFFKFLKKRIQKTDKKAFMLTSPYADAEIITTTAIKWLKSNFKDSFFLWIHYMDCHLPYFPPLRYIKNITDEKITKEDMIQIKKISTSLRNNNQFIDNLDERYKKIALSLYDAEVSYVDYHIGNLCHYLKRIDIFNRTNIILTADHGEALFEHNTLGHKASLYEELLRIPLVIKIEGNSIEKRRIEDQFQMIDLAPTILDIFNIPKESMFKGMSLLPLIQGKTDIKYNNKYIISAELHNNYRVQNAFSNPKLDYYILVSCRTNEWKLIYDQKENQVFLYNLIIDPLELLNLKDEKDKKIQSIKNNLLLKISPYIERSKTEEIKIKKTIKKIF